MFFFCGSRQSVFREGRCLLVPGLMARKHIPLAVIYFRVMVSAASGRRVQSERRGKHYNDCWCCHYYQDRPRAADGYVSREVSQGCVVAPWA